MELARRRGGGMVRYCMIRSATVPYTATPLMPILRRVRGTLSITIACTVIVATINSINELCSS